jgi:hypothetical protein
MPLYTYLLGFDLELLARIARSYNRSIKKLVVIEALLFL